MFCLLLSGQDTAIWLLLQLKIVACRAAHVRMVWLAGLKRSIYAAYKDLVGGLIQICLG